MQHETKMLPLEVKFAAGGTGMRFEGYGAYFGNVDAHGDVIQKGAFKRSLSESKKTGIYPSLLLQHGNWLGGDDNMPVGVWDKMSEDDKGLHLEGVLADTQRGKDAYTLLKMEPRSAINGLSIGGFSKSYTVGTKPAEPRRTITDFELMEVSLVTFPANPKARVTAVKSFNPQTLEAALRSDPELNLSKSAAVSVVAIVKRHLREGGVDDQVGREGADPDRVADALRRNIQLLRG